MKGLEALERIKNEKPQYFSTLYDSDMWEEDTGFIEKELIALEIIKAIGVFNVYEDAGGKYHLETMVDTVGLMKEDYDLLKEILE